MRIATGGIIHETATFVDSRTTMTDFDHDRGVIRGPDMIERFRGTNVCTGGFIDGADKHGFELVPLLRASAFPGGLIDRKDYDSLKTEMLERLRAAEANGGPVDGVLLDLHGAMVIEGIDDGDGDLIHAVRKAIGPKRPIVVTTDLHGNHTKHRIAGCDVLIGFDTYPHVDMNERGREAVDVILRILNDVLYPSIEPQMAICQVPLFWGTRCQVTAHPPMDEVMRRLHDIESKPEIVTMTIATGFPWADVPEVGTSVIVVTDGDRDLAQKTADEFGQWIWDNRQQWYVPPMTVRDAIAEGEKAGKHPIILADHGDNTGGGSPGDSTEVLRTFLELGLRDALVLYMVDEEVAKQAHAAGVGSMIAVRLGGKSAPVQGPPVEANAVVKAITTGEFAYDGPMFGGLTGSMGTSAWLQINGVSVVVVTAREQPFDMAFARSLGVDCAKMRYIAVKSAAHFRAAFEPIAGTIYNVDAAAILTHDFHKLTYKKRKRDVFPVEIRPN